MKFSPLRLILAAIVVAVAAEAQNACVDACNRNTNACLAKCGKTDYTCNLVCITNGNICRGKC
ncbi:hypothetical protein K7432_002079 [Basidiobolus ranarum]|uniref:Uncharacterized protein n=1 Tax=Basidiobolus ranarum TaxID=34480 RepID=A0ABR2W8N0_9FUNG